MEIVLGCGWLGAVVVPINTASRGLQLEHILRNCGARLLVAEAHLVDVVHALDVRDLALQTIWLIGEPAAEALAPACATSRCHRQASRLLPLRSPMATRSQCFTRPGPRGCRRG